MSRKEESQEERPPDQGGSDQRAHPPPSEQQRNPPSPKGPQNAVAETASEMMKEPTAMLKRRNYRTRERISWFLVVGAFLLLVVTVVNDSWTIEPTIIATIFGTVISLLVLGGKSEGK